MRGQFLRTVVGFSFAIKSDPSCGGDIVNSPVAIIAMSDFHQSLIASSWCRECASAREDEARSARHCSDEYMEFIRQRTSEYCEQPTPTCDAVLGNRLSQSVELSGFIRAIADASRAASRHPRIASEIYSATKEFVDTTTVCSFQSAKSLYLRSTIAMLIHSDCALKTETN
ncbi:hypothetical protein [Novipirellula caenicola]|uniref:Uncharacterized protein n=1 Tax=Novipirellula caenicola TaxID=1536901 RepID=A0ABP9VY24_9BACT